MKNRAITSSKNEAVSTHLLSLTELKQWAQGWQLEGDIAQHSVATLKNRRYILDKLLWFLADREYNVVDIHALRAFLHHTGKSLAPGVNRWGFEGNVGGITRQKIAPGTVATYHRSLSAFFSWCVSQGAIDASPMSLINTPIDRPDQIQPFTDDQIQALLKASKKTLQPRRNECLMWLLLDTGARVTELSQLTYKDVDLSGAPCLRVEGKGGKKRTLPLGKTSSRSLWMYLSERERDHDSPVFISEGGNLSGQGLSRSGIEQIVHKIGEAAGIDHARCSPHTFRHTFAVSFLRNGGNQFALMALLGHTDTTMTGRYVRYAQADIQKQHRQYSPADQISRKK